MTDKEINIKIAKACGWTFVDFRGIILCREPEWEAGKARTLEAIPDYCNDLNAMHEAEVSCIIPMTTPCYYDTLQFIIFRDKGMTDESPKVFTAWLAHATARQRAEAFLRTINPHTP